MFIFCVLFFKNVYWVCYLSSQGWECCAGGKVSVKLQEPLGENEWPNFLHVDCWMCVMLVWASVRSQTTSSAIFPPFSHFFFPLISFAFYSKPRNLPLLHEIPSKLMISQSYSNSGLFLLCVYQGEHKSSSSRTCKCCHIWFLQYSYYYNSQSFQSITLRVLIQQ